MDTKLSSCTHDAAADLPAGFPDCPCCRSREELGSYPLHDDMVRMVVRVLTPQDHASVLEAEAASKRDSSCTLQEVGQRHALLPTATRARHSCAKPIALYEWLIERRHPSPSHAHPSPLPWCLRQCLDAFITEERLSPSDAWYCTKCKDHVEAFKKLDLWQVPEVLVIHLKRFQYTSTSRDKIDATVRFPLEGLDLTPWCLNKNQEVRVQGKGGPWRRCPCSPRPPATSVRGRWFPPPSPARDHKSLQVAPLFDLFAVSNHYGGMGGGHYTAYARLFLDGEWYDFDDSRCVAWCPAIRCRAPVGAAEAAL